MKIAGIDPGTDQSALVVVDTSTGSILHSDIAPNLSVRNNILFQGVGWNTLVVEMVESFGMPVGREVFETVLWIGRFIEAAEGRTKSARVTRSEEKLTLCRSRKANDSTIRQAVIDRYGGDSKAVGNKKCKVCKGKGWCGRDHAVCALCGGSGWEHPPGPLAKLVGDMWQALAVVLTYCEREGINVSILSGEKPTFARRKRVA